MSREKNDLVTYSQRAFCFHSQFSLLIIIVSRIAIPHIDSSTFFIMKYLIRQVKSVSDVVGQQNNILNRQSPPSLLILIWCLFMICMRRAFCMLLVSPSILEYILFLLLSSFILHQRFSLQFHSVSSLFVNFNLRIHLFDIQFWY